MRATANGPLFNPPPAAYVVPLECSLRLTQNTTAGLQVANRAGYGERTIINGEEIRPAVARTMLNTDNLLAADGSDAGAAMIASTLYYIYTSSSRPAFAPSGLRASLTAPTLVNGVYYLGAIGDAAEWRYVGCAVTDAGVLLQDSLTSRAVSSYYNRVFKSLFICPGYNDDNLNTGYNVSQANFGVLNGGTVSYVDNGEDPVAAWFHWNIIAGGAAICNVGIGDNSITQPAAAVAVALAASRVCGCIPWLTTPTGPVLKTLSMLFHNDGVVNTSFQADVARSGAAADPPATYLVAHVAT